MERSTTKIATTVVCLVAIALLALSGCDSGAERIREINESPTTPAAERTPISAKIDAIELRDGDCINSTLPEGISIETVVIVPCAGQWQYRVLNSFSLSEQGDWPGKESFAQLGWEKCDRRFTYFLYPPEDSWRDGDRTVNCLQESFGISVSDPERLDRLVSVSSLSSGECFNEAPETGDPLVELVDCSGSWDLRVLSTLKQTESDSYPGYVEASRKTGEGCGEGADFIEYQSEESWESGHRTVLCLQQNPGQ